MSSSFFNGCGFISILIYNNIVSYSLYLHDITTLTCFYALKLYFKASVIVENSHYQCDIIQPNFIFIHSMSTLFIIPVQYSHLKIVHIHVLFLVLVFFAVFAVHVYTINCF